MDTPLDILYHNVTGAIGRGEAQAIVGRIASKRFFVRVIHDNGDSSILSHRGRSEWTQKTAEKYADDVWNKHGWVCYVVPA